METIFMPTKTAEDWKEFLAKPDLHWKTGFSAKALAYSWQEADGFPTPVQKVLNNSGLKDAQLLFGFPEWKTPLPGGNAASQNDICAIAKCDNGLISIAVEGKVNEGFGQTVIEWKQNGSEGKEERLHFLIQKPNLKNKSIDKMRYQLLHRTASALIEALKILAPNALLLVHFFSEQDESFADFAELVSLYGLRATKDALVGPVEIDDTSLYFTWITGEQRFLSK